MKRATQLFSESHKSRINAAVAAAESGTVAEIIPVVATASGRYDRADDLAGLLVGAMAMLLTYVGIARANGPDGDWRVLSIAWACAILLIVLVGGYFIGVAISSRVPMVRRLLTARRGMIARVQAAAASAFFDNRVRDTAGATGVLIYISLYERTAVLLADRTALEALGQASIDKFCADLVASLHTSDVTTAICGTIATIGDALAGPLPRTDDDVNELPDGLVLID